MANIEPLKKGDEVYIKPLNMEGKVLGGRAMPGEPEEDQFYQVQIIRYYRPAELQLIDRESEREKRQAELQQKTDRLARARTKVEAGDLTQSSISETLSAFDDLWQALGQKPFLKTK